MTGVGRVTVLGGGPAGLAAALRLSHLGLGERITVVEQRAGADPAGWGISLNEPALAALDEVDEVAGARVRESLHGWDTVSLRREREEITAAGSALAAITRDTFLRVLRERCRQRGVRLVQGTRVGAEEARRSVEECDLVVGADGAHSQLRAAFADEFGATVSTGGNRFVWLAAESERLSAAMLFRETPHGVVFAYSYPFAPGRFTFIVECGEEMWRRSGLSSMTTDRSLEFLRDVFADDLGADGRLRAGTTGWARFPTVRAERWSAAGGRAVLVGDAAHTAHFSVGMGTRLAVEDAVELGSCLREHRDRATALRAYQEARRGPVAEGQARAGESQSWFEQFQRYYRFPVEQLSFSWRVRQRTTTFDRLRRMDPAFTARVCRALGGDGSTVEPLAVPFSLPAGDGRSPVRRLPHRLVSVRDAELALAAPAWGLDPERTDGPDLDGDAPELETGLVLAPPGGERHGVTALPAGPEAVVEVDVRPALLGEGGATEDAGAAGAAGAVLEAASGTAGPVVLRAGAVRRGVGELRGLLAALGEKDVHPLVHLVSDDRSGGLEPALELSDFLRNEVGCPTVVTGAWSRDAANTAVGAGRVDLIGVATAPEHQDVTPDGPAHGSEAAARAGTRRRGAPTDASVGGVGEDG